MYGIETVHLDHMLKVNPLVQAPMPYPVQGGVEVLVSSGIPMCRGPLSSEYPCVEAPVPSGIPMCRGPVLSGISMCRGPCAQWNTHV